MAECFRDGADDRKPPAANKVFECRTCGRRFPSFQALGGHRTSHKRLKVSDGAAGCGGEQDRSAADAPERRRVHGCSVCGVEFRMGQALGGHMRRHGHVGREVGDRKAPHLRLFDLNLPPPVELEFFRPEIPLFQFL